MNLNDMSERTVGIKPCPVCMKVMTIKKSSAMMNDGKRKWFYFLYCNQCGYGPNSAFDTVFKAINHWNETTLSHFPVVGLFSKKPANLFTPRMFN